MMTSRTRRPLRARVAIVLALAAVTSAACGGNEDPLEIGLRRVALDLAFKDAEKAVPVEPRVIVQEITEFIDVPFEEFEVAQEEEAPERPPRPRIPRVIPPRATFVCPTAAPEDTPEVPAFHVRKGQPIPGTYPRHNTGKISFAAATLTGSLPFPANNEWDITDVTSGPRVVALRPEDQKQAVPPAAEANETVAPKVTRFTISRYTRGISTTHTTYEYDDDFLYLTERRTVNRGEETIFKPTPPIRFIALNVTEGTDSEVTFAGVDRDRNVAMTITSKIVGREDIDVCGEVFGSYRVEWQEQFVDLSTGTPTVSGNSNDQVNVWNIQFDNGLLVLREQLKYTIQTTIELAGAPVPVTLTVDVSSVVDKLAPNPLKNRTESTSPTPTPTTTPEDEEEG